MKDGILQIVGQASRLATRQSADGLATKGRKEHKENKLRFIFSGKLFTRIQLQKVEIKE